MSTVSSGGAGGSVITAAATGVLMTLILAAAIADAVTGVAGVLGAPKRKGIRVNRHKPTRAGEVRRQAGAVATAVTTDEGLCWEVRRERDGLVRM